MRAVAIIPARMASTRFRGKPLADIAGKSMIQRVYEQAMLCDALAEVWIATEDQEIFDHVTRFGGKSILTGPYDNGTMRVAAAFRESGLQADIVVNIQGDQPGIHPEVISLLIAAFSNPEVQIATLVRHSEDREAFDNNNLVKVNFDEKGRAKGFFRNAKGIIDPSDYYYHIGTYAFRPDVLLKIVQLQPVPEEKQLHLEQLRWMHYGFPVHAVISPHDVHAVDVPEDITRICKGMDI